MTKKLLTILSYLDDFEKNLSSIFAILELNPATMTFEIDHVAIHVASNNDGETILSEVSKLNDIAKNPISDAVVNGRRVLLFKLINPVHLFGKEIYFLELLFPKPNNFPQESRLDHIEVVVPYPNKVDNFLDVLTHELGESIIRKAKDKLLYKESFPEVNGLINTHAISINFIDSQGLSVKFHPMPLYEIVKKEKNSSKN